MVRSWLITSLTLVTLLAPAAARADGESVRHGGAPSDERLLERALREATRCRMLAYGRDSGAECRPAEPPDRYRDIYDDVLALAWGDDLTNWGGQRHASLGAQRACQVSIGRAVAAEVSTALRRQLYGSAGARKLPGRSARPALDAIRRRCQVEVREGGGVVLPRVGSQCRAAVGAPGTVVDAESLAHCIQQLIATWVERARPSATPRRSNVVVILTDDQRADSVDRTHSPDAWPIMPVVMDRLAGEGVVFENSYVTNPVCGPSRATAMTGRYSSKHGVWQNGQLFDESSTVATWLHAAGYRTGFLGKYTNDYPAGRGGAGLPALIPPGWDEWKVYAGLGSTPYDRFTMIENGATVEYGVDEEVYATDVLAQQAVDFIRQSSGDGSPFLLFVAATAPHYPWTPAPRHAGQLAASPVFRPPSYFEADVSDKPFWVQQLAPWSPLRELGTHVRRIAELEMLLAVDELTEDVLDTLDELGLSDDTVVIFTSDNGEAWGEHRWNSKACPWEECLRVPLIIRAPGLAPLPRRDQRMAVNVDLAPTIAELAGVPVPAFVNGDSLVKALDDTADTWRSAFLIESFSGGGRNYGGLRTLDALFVRYLGGERELYDLAQDPYQLDNLANDPAQEYRMLELLGREAELRRGRGF